MLKCCQIGMDKIIYSYPKDTKERTDRMNGGSLIWSTTFPDYDSMAYFSFRIHEFCGYSQVT